MKALVVYESLWGNTAAIANAIAEGIGADARAVHTAQASPELVASADMLVAGAPLLGFSLPTEQMRSSIGQNPGNSSHPPDLSGPSMRTWIEGLADRSGAFATFETRIWWSPGSSAKTIASLLVEKGMRQAANPERFIVKGKYGPLKNGEIERARQWGTSLA